MPKKSKEWPERGELIIGTVTKVNPFSAFVSLEEYENKEGMIHISEVARKWIKDVREHVKVGQKIVALVFRVDERKGHISLSLKRIRKRDAEEKMKEFKREKKAEKMLSEVAKELKISLDKAYEEIGFKLEEIFGEMFKGFQTALMPDGIDILVKRGIPEKFAKLIKSVAEKQMEVKEVSIKSLVELKSFKPDGIDIIKNVLKDAKEKYNLDIRYVSAPRYSLILKTKYPKIGEKKLKDIAEKIIENLKSLGGEGTFKAG